MAVVDYSKAPIEVITSNDNVVVKRVLETIAGGRALDVSGFTPDVIPGGHVIVKGTDGEYKPLGITDGAYNALPAGHEYVGFQNGSILKSQPAGAIIVRGTINPAASIYPITAEMQTAINEALPTIRFEEDK